MKEKHWFKFKIKTYENDLYSITAIFTAFIFENSKKRAIDYIKKYAKDAFMTISYEYDSDEIKLPKGVNIYNEIYEKVYKRPVIIVNYKNRYKIGLASFDGIPVKISEFSNMADRLKKFL